VALGILHKVTEFCQKNSLLTQKDKVVVAVSGGPDSLCLSHLLVALSQKTELTLIIAHLNHQLRGIESQADADFVKDMAAHWQLPIFLETHNIANLAAKRKQSIEETGRQVRYAFLWRVAAKTKANTIAVGHNADDQVETILMHFLRGTGLAGLRGIMPKIEIARLRLYPEDIPSQSLPQSPKIIRPLLEISRTEVEAYCQENKLSPRWDSSNQDTTFFRNRLRHELIPYLETYNPKIRQVLQHTAKVVAADTVILGQQMDRAWHLIVRSESSEVIEFDLKLWSGLPLALKRSILRQAVHSLRRNLRNIGFEPIKNAIAVLEKGGTGAKASLPQGLVLTVSYDTFTIASEDPIVHSIDYSGPQLPQGQILKVTLPGVTTLSDTNWQLKAKLLGREGLTHDKIKRASRWEAYLDADIVGHEAILRSRQPGDIFYPLGLAGHSKKVNEFMINEKIPAGWRNRILLFVSNNQILWICGYRPDERARVRASTQRALYLQFEAK
jgi:tRNA(Ile)-lysidine synthase